MENIAQILAINKQTWDQEAHRFFGRTALPDYGPYAYSEEDLHLFGEITGKKVLDIGCGSGHSLQYMAARGAAELWGLDLSRKQMETTMNVLGSRISPDRLFESPMEEDPGIPHQYFDIVYSIYALCWTVDLAKTLAHVANYLKPGGIFIFSWEHPLHSRIQFEDGTPLFSKSYLEEGPYLHEKWHAPAVMHQRKLSTYLNALIQAGFEIERVIEEVALTEAAATGNRHVWYTHEKAQLVPATLIIKSRKRSPLP